MNQEEGGPDAGYKESVADNASRSSTAKYKIRVQDLKNSSGFSSSEAVGKSITCTVIFISLNFFFMISSDIATTSGKSWLDKIQETAQNFLQSVNLFSTPVTNLGKHEIMVANIRCSIKNS